MDGIVCALGDLVEDVVVRCDRAPVRGADVVSEITRHRRGSAANTAAVVARLGGRARFVGRVGPDHVGERLIAELAATGVDCRGPRGGRTGTVVVVVEPGGERTMFSDRRGAADLEDVDEAWLDGVAVLHVPYYAFGGGRLGDVALHLMRAARRRGAMVSIDPSTVTMLDERFAALVRDVEPDVVLCNEDEAEALGVSASGLPGAKLVVVKQGPAPVLLRGSTIAEVPTPPVRDVVDTTGAGDAFAAGFLLAIVRGADPVDAVRAGQAAAACVIRGAGADAWVEAS
ncbi:MAG: ribokinase-like domain-containing protein [Acidimicrobiia bacterium]|nr:MAG: ribokinase-like domain-containing protein [Acidimicrobiia bacterium]